MTAACGLVKHKPYIHMSCYRQMRNTVNNLNKKSKKDYLSNNSASSTGNLK